MSAPVAPASREVAAKKGDLLLGKCTVGLIRCPSSAGLVGTVKTQTVTYSIL